MSEVRISDNIVIDMPQNVEIAIRNLTGRTIDFEIIKKFITHEKNTMFYFDKKMNSSTEPGYYSDYLWIDTGVRDGRGNPIMISMSSSYGEFKGHYTDTPKVLVDRIKSFGSNRKNSRDIEKNYSRFIQKYKGKAEERSNISIEDPDEYVIIAANDKDQPVYQTALGKAIMNAGIDMTQIPDEAEDETRRHDAEAEAAAEEAETIDIYEQPIEEFTKEQTAITVTLLYDQMEKMQNYIDELLAIIENKDDKVKTSQDEIDRLVKQNKEYKEAMVNIRAFNSASEAQRPTEIPEGGRVRGHNLLQRNETILILGATDVKEAEMKAIAKDYYGFEKDDLEFFTDYDKIKNIGNRIHSSNRFKAVIFGSLPHKVEGIGNAVSIIDEYIAREDVISIKALTSAGELKISKSSFKAAIGTIYNKLRER